jgi:single-stranded DNA-binding protein
LFESLPGGGEVMSLDLSTRMSASRNVSGRAEDRPRHLVWHRVVAFAPAVGRAARDLAPGDDVSVRGFIERRYYERGGVRHELCEIVADWIQRLNRG